MNTNLAVRKMCIRDSLQIFHQRLGAVMPRPYGNMIRVQNGGHIMGMDVLHRKGKNPAVFPGIPGAQDTNSRNLLHLFQREGREPVFPFLKGFPAYSFQISDCSAQRRGSGSIYRPGLKFMGKRPVQIV